MKQFEQIDKSELRPLYQNFDCPWGGKNDIYLVPIKKLHLNADNGRIVTWVSGHQNNPNTKHLEDMTQEEWNETLARFIQESSSKENNEKTKRSLERDGQLKVGAILTDGTVVAGNRRCSLLMSLLDETGDYEKYGYFKCAIFDVPNDEEGRKQLKRLETKTQYGEDTPVSYGPIEKLVDIYKNVIEDGHPYSSSEYQNFLNLKKGEMDKFVLRAKILVDFLDYAKKPKNYEVARVEKLDGPINELAGLRKKVGDREWNRIKSSFYRTLIDGFGQRTNSSKSTKHIRDQIRSYEKDPNTFEKDLAKLDDDLLNADAQSFGVETTRTPNVTQSRADLFASSAMNIQKNAARTKPISYVETALKSIGDLDRGAISIMKPDEKEKFFKTLDALIKTASKYTKDKIE